MKIALNIKRNSDWPTTREVMGFIYYKELIPQVIVTDKGGRSAMSVSNGRDQ